MNNDERNFFGEFLRLHHTEELLRLQRRCEMQNNPRLAEILGDEIVERDMIEKAERNENPPGDKCKGDERGR